MALTSAERVRRYREKLKRNPEKAEEISRKNLERIKSKKKKVSQMTEEEKNEHRKMWREEKRKQRALKSNNETVTGGTSDSESPITSKAKTSSTNISKLDKNKHLQYVERKCKLIVYKYKLALKRISTLTKDQENQKKRYYRLKKMTSKVINTQQNLIDKQKAREEILEMTLRRTYAECEKRIEKQVLRRLIKNSHPGKKTYVAKLMGLNRKLRDRQKKNRRTCCKEVEMFWLRDDVTRATAGKKECRSFGKEKQQIRYTVDTLTNLYKKYKEEGGQFGMTTLWKYKPFYVLSPQLNSRNTCLCIKHANIELKFKALKLYGQLTQKTYKDVLTELTCDPLSYSCASNVCSRCKNYKVRYNFDDNEPKKVTWWQWERVDHEYIKKYGKETKTVKTKKTVKSLKHTSITELKHAFNKDIISFKKHVFIMRHQQEQYKKKKNNLNKNEAVVICDFSENYDCKMREEVQALHFGSSKNQVTLHTGVIFWKTCMQSFCTISENNGHKPENIWAHLTPILDEIKMRTPDVKILHFYSDGPTSQYRQKGNFCLLSVLPKEMGFEYCTWSFSESGHGKSIADGIGGSDKRTLDKHVSYGVDATNALQIYYLLSECMKTVQIFLVDDIKVKEYAIKLHNLRTLIGTLKLHQVITLRDDTNNVKFRDLSCFCGDANKGMCLCYSPQTHMLTNNISQANKFPTNHTKRESESQNVLIKSNTAHLADSVVANVEKATVQQESIIVKNLAIQNDDQVKSSLMLSPKLIDYDNINDFTFISMHSEIIGSQSPTIEFIDLTQSTEVITPSYNCLQILQSTTDPFLPSIIPPNECLLKVDKEFIVHKNNNNAVLNKENFNLVTLDSPEKSYKPASIKSKYHSQVDKINAKNCNMFHRVFFYKMIMCIACKFRYCSSCVGNPFQRDFICNFCLTGDISD